MKLTQHDSFLFEGLVLGLVDGLSLSGDTSLHLRLRWSSHSVSSQTEETVCEGEGEDGDGEDLILKGW